MFSRSLYILHMPRVRLRVKFGNMPIKKLPLGVFYSDLIGHFKKLSIFQCLKLPAEADMTKVRLDTSEDSGSKNEVKVSNDISDKLIRWALQNNLSYVSFSCLLKILHEHGVKNLPKNSKALLKAKQNELNLRPIPPGVYYHFGLENNLKILIEILLVKKYDVGPVLNISIFIDELLLSITNKDFLWVILGSVVDFNKIVFAVGAYRGVAKPEDSNLFLSDFVKEVGELCNRGVIVNQTNYRIAIKRLICDTLARAFILNVQSHTGYLSCTKCWEVGEHVNKICFPNKSWLKTDEDFEKSFMYKRKKTELLKIPNFGVVSNMPLDYMHLVCFGVVRKLLMNLLNKLCVKTVSEKIHKITKLHEFQNKLKSLCVLSSWNAMEFRRFLLYHGPVVLHGMIEKKYYDNFLLLHVGCRLLCMDHSEETARLGKTLLHTFIEEYKDLYGVEEMSHNVHGLHHLVDDYIAHGILDEFSSFIYEKFLGNLRRSMKKSKKKSLPHLTLKEACSRMFSRSLTKLTKREVSVVGVKTNENYWAYLHLSGNKISSLEGNNYLLLKNNKLIRVTEIFKNGKGVFVSGKEFSSAVSFYKKPLESSKLEIFKVGDLSEAVETWSVSTIDKKCMNVPLDKERSVLIGLLNES